MAKSTSKSAAKKNPLTWHKASGRWCINVTDHQGRRRTFYFSDDLTESIQDYNAGGECWRQGYDFRKQRRPGCVTTLADMVNAFLTRCKARVPTKEMSPRTFADYVWIGKQLVSILGRNVNPEKLGPADFAKFRAEMLNYAPRRSSKSIIGVKTFFKWAYGEEIIDHIPRFGNDFKPLAKSAERDHKASRGVKLYHADEIRAMLTRADDQFQAMLLLACNAGLGNSDLSQLPLSAIDLDRGWIHFPRPKTGVARRVPLWPETIAAIRTVIAKRRPKPEYADLAFLTSRGSPYVIVAQDGKRVDKLNPLFRRLAQKAGVHREGCGLYTLRHVTQTIGDEARDPLATAHIMGHADGTISGLYRETISDERLKRVTDHIRGWLFEGEKKGRTAPRKKSVTAEEKPTLRVVG